MIEWMENWDEAVKRAGESSRPIFLFLHSPS